MERSRDHRHSPAPIEIPFDTLSRITLTLDDILPRPPYRGAVGASVVVLMAQVDTPELSGHRRFSVPASELSRWLDELEQFDQRRTGAVTLLDEDASAFRLVFAAADRAGHLTVSVELRWGDAVANFRWRRMLVVDTAPIDPSALPRILDGPRALHRHVIAQHQPHS